MYAAKATLVALSLFSSSLLVACFPYGARRERQVVGEPPAAKQPPSFFMDLYYCWRDRQAPGSSSKGEDSVSQGVEDCLFLAGEDNASIPEILLADKVVGVEGRVVQTANTNGPEYLTISFNLSRANPHDRIHSSELRVHKNAVDQRTLDSLTSKHCNPSEKIEMALLASADGTDTNTHIMKMLTLTRQDFLETKWIRFSNLTGMCLQWVDNMVNAENMIIRLAFLEGCAGIKPASLGFSIQGDEQPMLLAFQETMNKTQTYHFHQALVTERDDNTEGKRSLQSTLCSLKPFTINFDQASLKLQPDATVISPPSYTPNLCMGECHYPIPDFLNASLHTQIQSFLHIEQPHQVPQPCCIATELEPLVIVERLGSSMVQTTSYDDIIATKCGCA